LTSLVALAPVAVSTEHDHVLEFVLLDLRPFLDVVDLQGGNSTARRDGASVASLDEERPFKFAWNGWAAL
jgi:hypothetical protein